MSVLTSSDITKLIECWQRHHPPLVADGIAGPNTLRSLREGDIEKCWPLRKLTDGREPVITSGFKTENSSRPTHDGADLFFPWLDFDLNVSVGDGGAVRVNGQRRWWIPPGTEAIAAAAGVVTIAGKIGTGWRCWVDHGNGERTGYFHGSKLLVAEGDEVVMGDPLIVIGDNPKAHDPKHLHFEVSPADHYAPRNPRLWLRDAKYL